MKAVFKLRVSDQWNQLTTAQQINYTAVYHFDRLGDDARDELAGQHGLIAQPSVVKPEIVKIIKFQVGEYVIYDWHAYNHETNHVDRYTHHCQVLDIKYDRLGGVVYLVEVDGIHPDSENVERHWINSSYMKRDVQRYRQERLDGLTE